MTNGGRSFGGVKLQSKGMGSWCKDLYIFSTFWGTQEWRGGVLGLCKFHNCNFANLNASNKLSSQSGIFVWRVLIVFWIAIGHTDALICKLHTLHAHLHTHTRAHAHMRAHMHTHTHKHTLHKIHTHHTLHTLWVCINLWVVHAHSTNIAFWSNFVHYCMLCR